MLTKFPSLIRRLAALVYDSFIVFSFSMLVAAIALLFNQHMPRFLFQLYLILTNGLFLSWFWRKGQTLGMLAWKIHLVDNNRQRLSWSRALLRYFISLFSVGCAGVGFLWCLVDKEKQSLHDRLAGTKTIQNS